MPKHRLTASLALIVLLAFAAATAAQDAGNTCDPADPPWGKELLEPDSIFPVGNVLDTSFVIRKKEGCVPIWSSFLCQGTYTRCTTEGSTAAPCSAAAPCANARTCLGADTPTSCTNNKGCTTGAKKCVKAWGWDKPVLRTYGFPKDPKKSINPKDPNDPNIKWALPGPTLRARTEILADPSQPKSASNKTVTPGTRIRLALYNYMDPQDYNNREQCSSAGPGPYVPTYPQCFHGAELTNLHYHGSHVSPQPPQDYVLLELWPFDSTNVPETKDTPTPKVGMYQTDINPLPWNQPPGTHWYHPHKHGSTALQVLNGMSGAMFYEGPFDDWLGKLYDGQGKLTQKLLMLQQVQSELNFLDKNTFPEFKRLIDFPPQVLVNGMATPNITMRPGEIQRFRFVGASVEASASLEIGFDQRFREIRQIAQDGIQFAWQNYDRQPYRDSSGMYNSFKLAPGQRADFLVQAPMQPGMYAIEHNVTVEGLKDKVKALHRADQSVLERIPDMMAEMMMVKGVEMMSAPIEPTSGTPLLFTIEVAGPPKPMIFPVTQGTDPACAGANPPVRCWPKTPAYLQDLTKPSTPARQVDFTMQGDSGPDDDGNPPNFFINRTQYDHHCAGATMARDTVEDWQVGNVQYTPGSDDALLPHPFHIHVNPFQVVRNSDRTFEPPYVWQDTIALPVVDLTATVAVPTGQDPISSQADAEARCPGICDTDSHATWTGAWTAGDCTCQQVTSRPAGPIWSNSDAKEKCPRSCQADNSTWNGQWRTTIPGLLSECDCVTKSDNVQLRQAFEDYSGAYVIHCHFLGHEDRGMMWNVQTVCQKPEPWTFGLPRPDGGADDCTRRSTTVEPLHCCPDANGKTTCGPQ